MIRLKKLAFTGAIACGLLGMAAAQQIDGDATGQAGSAAKNFDTETSTDANVGLDSSAAEATSEAQADGVLNADSSRGSLSDQPADTATTATPSERAGADADLNLQDREIQKQADVQADSNLQGEAADTTAQARDAAGQTDETRNQSQLASDAEIDAALEAGAASEAAADSEADTENSSAGLKNQTDASAQARTQDQFENNMAGMTFRSNVDGLVLDNVADNSAAAQIGLQPGDEIVRFNGQWVNSRQQLDRMLSNFDGSRPVDISFRRDGRQFGRQIALEGSSRSQSAMRPNYDQYDENTSASANMNANSGINGEFGNQPIQQAGFGQTYPASDGYYSGSPVASYQPQMTYGGYSQPYGYSGDCCCDDNRDKCCRKAQRRARRAWRRACR